MLVDSTACTNHPTPLFLINPFSQRQWLALTLLMFYVFAFCVIRAAVFAEPAITQIEEVGRLVHKYQV